MPKSTELNRRELLAATGAGSAALLLAQGGAKAQPASARPVIFAHTTVANADAVHDDVALAVQGDRIAAIGPTDQVLGQYPECRNL